MFERKLGLWKTDLIGNLARIENFMYVCMYINMYLRYLDRLAAQFSLRLV